MKSMLSAHPYDQPNTCSRVQNGFALVATISVMVLLVMIALAMLSLSTISVRSDQHISAQATAQANARMALMLALGELQKHAGKDQRITARANLLNENSPNAQLTGVWESLQLTPSNPPSTDLYKKDYRDTKFISWLVSTANPHDAENLKFPDSPLASAQELWGEGTLGSSVTEQQRVKAGKVSLEKNSGSYAWAVMDEGTKVRVNTHYNDNAPTTADKITQLGTGERPRTEFISGLNSLEAPYFKEGAPEYRTLTSKGLTLLNFGMAAESTSPDTSDIVKKLTHDISTVSKGLFTNVAQGGLKEDFLLLCHADELPTKLQNSGPYLTHLGLEYQKEEVPSSPSWKSFAEYANLYKKHVSKIDGVPYVRSMAPMNWNVSTPIKPNDGSLGDKPIYDYIDTTPIEVLRTPPPGLVITPSIARVQLVFALVARDIYTYPADGDTPDTAPERQAAKLHDPWHYFFRKVPPEADLKVDYVINLMITPIITLHNPYNVTMQCEDLKINFIRTPFALKIYRDGEPMSSNFVPIDMMYGLKPKTDPQGNIDGAHRKIFGLNLMGSKTLNTFTLLPGEVKVFSPYLEPTGTWRSGASNKTVDIWMKHAKTHDIDCLPGWPGDGLGMSSDIVLGKYWRQDLGEKGGNKGGVLGISKNSEIHVEFAPRGVDLESLESDPYYNIDPKNYNKFTLQMEKGTQIVNTIQIDYEQPEGLQETLLGGADAVRWPTGSTTVLGSELHDHYTTFMSDLENVQPFAIFSVQGKSTHGAFDSSGDDGRFASKPYAFGHTQSSSSVYKAVSEHAANASHEINIQKIPYQQGTASFLDIDPTTHRTNYFSGHTSQYGTKFGITSEIPLAPLQSLTQLNNANPGGSSGYLPRFAQPIGNSWAHPMMSTDRVIQRSADSSYNLLDHSYLLNASLYDQFYFSGIADNGKVFGNGNDAKNLLIRFSTGSPLCDPRMQFIIPSSKSTADLEKLINDIDSDETTYQKIASWQTMRGAFNVNSTSVEAWKAMLASIHDSQAIVNQIDKSNNTTSMVRLTEEKSREARFSRFRLPAADKETSSVEDTYWMGTRELSEPELHTLASNIVAEVRARGPFLSMADFVNRRLGTDQTDSKFQRGALQQAIDNSNINSTSATESGAGFEIEESAGNYDLNDYQYKNITAGTGSSYQGAPGYLSQSDILNTLGNAATVRSDTFTIRAYGEAKNNAGVIIATAYCEATVQRNIDWVDPSYSPEDTEGAHSIPANVKFGRRFTITSFRWLNPSEI